MLHVRFKVKWHINMQISLWLHRGNHWIQCFSWRWYIYIFWLKSGIYIILYWTVAAWTLVMFTLKAALASSLTCIHENMNKDTCKALIRGEVTCVLVLNPLTFRSWWRWFWISASGICIDCSNEQVLLLVIHLPVRTPTARNKFSSAGFHSTQESTPPPQR